MTYNLYLEMAGSFAKTGENDYVVLSGIVTLEDNRVLKEKLLDKYNSIVKSHIDRNHPNPETRIDEDDNITLFRAVEFTPDTHILIMLIKNDTLGIKTKNNRIYELFFVNKFIDILIKKHIIDTGHRRMLNIHLNEKDFDADERVSLTYYLKINQRLEKERDIKFTIVRENLKYGIIQKTAAVFAKAIFLPAAKRNRDFTYTKYSMRNTFHLHRYTHQ